MKDIEVAVRGWLTAHSSDDVVWFTVGIVDSAGKVDWRLTQISPSSFKRLDQGVVGRFLKATKDNKNSLANQSLDRFHGDGELRDPYLYRAKGKAIGIEIGAERSKGGAHVQHLREVVPEGCATLLTPFVHWDGVDSRYVAALVVCAKAKSKIWNRMPELKAHVLPLTEPLRHTPKFGVPRGRERTNELRLLRVLLLGNPEFLFQGDWHEWSRARGRIEENERLRAEWTATFSPALDLLKSCKCKNIDFFPACCEKSFQFCKSLYYFEAGGDRGQLSRPVSQAPDGDLWAVSRFMEKAAGNGCKVKPFKGGDGPAFRWPATPGVSGAIPLIRLLGAFEARSAEVVATATDFGVRFLGRTEFRGLRGIARSVWRRAVRVDSGGRTTAAIYAAMTADLSVDLRNFKVGSDKEDHRVSLLRPAAAPVAYPEFAGRKLTVWWQEPVRQSSLGGGLVWPPELRVGLLMKEGDPGEVEAKLSGVCSAMKVPLFSLKSHRGLGDLNVVVAHDSELAGKLSAPPFRSGKPRIYLFVSSAGRHFRPKLLPSRTLLLGVGKDAQSVSSDDWDSILRAGQWVLGNWPSSIRNVSRRIARFRSTAVSMGRS